ncbi:MAG: tetratricopeptide repeat protein [Thermodesulfobacteriota bacterium]
MAEKIRYTRRDLKEPDEFISTFGRTIAWCKENRSKVALAVLALVVALAAAFGTRGYLRWQEGKAAGAIWPLLEEARNFLESPPGADNAALMALEGKIASLAKEHSGTRASAYAHYYLGSLAFRRGDYAGSLFRFHEGIRTGKAQGVLRFLLRNGVANALEAKGDYAGAASAYREAADAAGPAMKTDALFGEARVLGLSGRKAEAVAVYRHILKENPETGMKDMIEFMIARLE